MAEILNSYDESHQTATISLYSPSFTKIGQTVVPSADATLDSLKFYIKKVGSPTGSLTASIYATTAVTGGYAPTGSALASVTTVDLTTLPITTSLSLVQFSFSGITRISLSSGSRYGVALEYSGSDSSNYISAGSDDTILSDPGNMALYTPSVGWGAESGDDTIYYLYGIIAPVASFTPSQTDVNILETITFTDTSIHNPTSWSWDFGDSSTAATTQNPTHSYSSAGTYTITLTATNEAGSDTATTTITVVDKPTLTGISSLTGVSSITFS